jgi:hypothetical protein
MCVRSDGDTAEVAELSAEVARGTREGETTTAKGFLVAGPWGCDRCDCNRATAVLVGAYRSSVEDAGQKLKPEGAQLRRRPVTSAEPAASTTDS